MRNEADISKMRSAPNEYNKLSQGSIALCSAHMQTRRTLELTRLDLVAELSIVSRYTLGCSSLLPPGRHRVASSGSGRSIWQLDEDGKEEVITLAVMPA